LAQQTYSGKRGQPAPILANAIIALQNAPEWRDVLAFDSFALETIVRKSPPWERNPQIDGGRWTDHDDVLFANWLQHQCIKVSPGVAHDAVSAVAKETEYHPVRDYLTSLTWDGLTPISVHRIPSTRAKWGYAS
jgi:predicted P-loop ATPase